MFILDNSPEGSQDVLVTEDRDAYTEFWLPLYRREQLPKFLLQAVAQSPADPAASFVGGFILQRNRWHDDDGPGEHARVRGIQRWIAWHVPTGLHRFIAGADLAELSCISPTTDYTYDNTGSDVLMNDPALGRVLHTVRDLTREDIPALRALRAKVLSEFARRFSASPHEVAMYFHYPVRSRLALLHLHVALGHRESGPLQSRTHDLDDVLHELEAVGTYHPERMAHYQLNFDQDGSLHQIASAVGHPPKAPRQIDVVVPCHAKDEELLAHSVRSLRLQCKQIRKIIVVSERRLLPPSEAGWFPESAFRFTKQDMGSGWRYQQALKLHAPFVIPNLAEDVLLVDADTVWHRPVTFVTEDGKGLYSLGRTPHDVAGYDAFFTDVLLPLGLRRHRPGRTAIAHHMLFQRSVLAQLFADLGRQFGRPIWNGFARGKPSEWELYYNFAVTRCADRVVERELRFAVTGSIAEAIQPCDPRVDFVACHSHRRRGVIDTHENGQ